MFFVCGDLTFKQILTTKPKNIKHYSVRALKRYLNEKNLIHVRVMATSPKFSPHIFETYFKSCYTPLHFRKAEHIFLDMSGKSNFNSDYAL